MKFTNKDVQLTPRDIENAQRELSLRFPAPLTNHFLKVNGGKPDPHVYEDARIDTTISESLALKSTKGRHTAIETYRHLVLNLELLPANFFPFAADSGGDYFFADCSTEDGDVYLYRHDTNGEPLIPLGFGVDEFWARLKPED